MVEPSARRPACRSALASACGRPPLAVAPRPTSLPACDTMTQPTLGLGALRPRASSPSAIAAAIHSTSSVNPQPLPELLVLALLFFLTRRLRRLLLLLPADDLGVGAVRGIELDVGGGRRGDRS